MALSIAGQGYNSAQNTVFTASATATPIQQNSLIKYHELIWTVSGTVSACQVSLDTAPDGVTWTVGGAITAQTCTSSGNSAVTGVVSANYVRVNMSTFTGSGSVTVQYEGWVSNPSGGGGGSGTVSANSGSAGALTYYPAAGGSTTVNPDTNLTDASNLLTYTGSSGMLASAGPLESGANGGTAGQLKLFGSTSSSATITANAAANTMTASTSFAATSENVTVAYNIGGHLADSGTAPTIGTCGTSPSVVASNGTITFELNVGTGGTASTCGFTLPTATTGWECDAVDVSNPTTGGGYYVKQTSAISTTSVTLTGYSTSGSATAWTASDILLVKCRAF